MDLLLESVRSLVALGACLCAALAVALFLRAIGRGLHHPGWGFALAWLCVPAAVLLQAHGLMRMIIPFVLIFSFLLWAAERREAA